VYAGQDFVRRAGYFAPNQLVDAFGSLRSAFFIAVSALLTTTMVKQRDVVEALDDIGLRSAVKVMVGGAPVTRDWAEEIGADGYSEDAVGAVAVAKELPVAKAL